MHGGIRCRTVSQRKRLTLMITIFLNKMIFYAHHGIHDEETVTGTQFELNITVSFPENGNITSINDTVNYVTVYNIIKENMKSPSRLLETVIMKTAEDIYRSDPRIKTINISISKINPPINNFTGNVGVNY